MQGEGHKITNESVTAARNQLAGLLTGLVDRIPGAKLALLATVDGFKTAYSQQLVDDADTTAAGIAGMLSLARAFFRNSPGDVRQIAIEHDAGLLFVMSASLAGRADLGSVLAVLIALDTDPGQCGHEMEKFIKGLDELLVVQARRNTLKQGTVT
ncbi:roadblock/LC7 domain-containing protein [Streptomyces sp. NBC_01411]|uniref:roadblock/LC7 domain-containing protein n=1 Tax=Streptomyces sp. NBC_01411 TaxID=2903857 RepID=UPI003250000E